MNYCEANRRTTSKAVLVTQGYILVVVLLKTGVSTMMVNLQILLIGAVLMLFYTSAQCSKEVHKLEIKERGTQFEEEVEIDRKDGTVLYKVPAHNDVAKSDVLFDYEAGYFATRIPKLKECYIQSIPKDRFSSAKEIRKNLQLYKMLNSTTPVPVKTISSAVIKERRINGTELSSSFSSFCGVFKVYKVKQIDRKVFLPTKRNKRSGIVKDITVEVKTQSIKIKDGNILLTANTCKPLQKYYPALTRGGCIRDPDNWKFLFKGSTSICIYTAKCVLSYGILRCEEEHFLTGIICYDVACY